MEGDHQKMSTYGGTGEATLNHGTRNDHQEVRCWIPGDRLGLSEEDESRINIGAINVNDSHVLEASVTAQSSLLLKQQNQSHIPVRWEKFLPLRTLKVLLVENDDSTRQVVSALLRNCCYEVTAVPNVLEAWRILEDQKNHIDIVLTEVIIPCFSGVGLLCKIMSHKTHKTIPVIMMSSNDSMGIVFKCLSKGAADFLVKPIRKNELKNLWQHVWRRCHSSSGSGSGSGSESGIQGKIFTNSKSEDDSDNNSDCNDKEGNGSIGWNIRDGSDNGSGTQSSWTKRAMEVDSQLSMCPSKQLSTPHDSACAQFTHPRPETFCTKEISVDTCMDNKEQEIVADVVMGKDLDIGGTSSGRVLKDESYQSDKVSVKLTSPAMEISPDYGRNAADVVRYMGRNALHERNALPVDWRSDNTNQRFTLSAPDNIPKILVKFSENKDKGCIDVPSLEQSLKRLRSAGEVGTPSNDERNVLKRSNPSAFSRYPTSAASIQDNSSGAAPLNQGSNGSSDNNDMGSTNKTCVTKPGLYKEVSTSSIMCNHPASAFHPVQPQNSTVHSVEQEKIHEVAASPVIGRSSGSQKQVQVQHHHHHYHHHHHHHVHALPSEPDQDESSHENLKETVAFCGSSNAVNRSVETNAASYSLNGSNSSTKQGSDGNNGCSATKNTGETNIESASCLAEKGGLGSGDGSGCGNVTIDQNRCSQREAALNKFRQKRKARNFSKKVRYQSRKRLAEQRPRLHGQFVRRIAHNENK